ncbi:MAG: hypothetical protein FJ316_10705 [SAR202 cluster bacterium]|nr:hypothetical protein [SAR202 cluster bacterium]
MERPTVDKLLEVLQQRAPVRPAGKGWRTRCPNPGHADRHPSFFLYPGGGGRCFSQCGKYWPPQELAELLGVALPAPNQGLTLGELAQAKGLPEDFLRALGVADGVTGMGKERRPCVDIPYMDQAGQVTAVQKRVSLEGHPRFLWRRGDHATVYGLWRLKDIRLAGWVALVEGPSDCWTLWLHRIPALGLPGASTWKEQYGPLLQGLTHYLWHEADGGGDGLVKAVSLDLPQVRIIEAPTGVKDPSELYLQAGQEFQERFQALLSAARPASELRAEALSAEARECFQAAQPLLDDPELLTRLADTLTALGYAGDTRPALISYIAVTSRLLAHPLNLAYISPSAAGKNAAVEAPLPLFPGTACYLVRAASSRALVYNDEVFTHRIVILTEADSLPEEGPAASAMRSLMSDREMSYEVVEKGEDGRFTVRKIIKPGPTGLITTSTRPLGDQASTRTLTVTIADTAEQTRLVLLAQAARANQALGTPELGPWVALQRWLELAGERRVVIPYAKALADLVPASAVRMRRDFPQLLTVVQAMALLHQRERERDPQGRIVAALEDYAHARWLLEEVFTTTVHEGVTPAIRETVAAVAHLSSDGSPVTEQQLVQELGLAASTIHYRVRRALRGGWLVNQVASQRGVAAQLLPGAALPEGCPLPSVAELVAAVRVIAHGIPSNSSNSTPGPDTEQLGPRNSNQNSKEFANGEASYSKGEFEEFESFPHGQPHTEAPDGEEQPASHVGEEDAGEV